MEKTSETTDDAKFYLMADALVTTWMNANKAYLLDGDPRILHPKAKTALITDIAGMMTTIAAMRVRGAKKRDGEA